MISQDERKRPGPPKKPPIREEDVQGFKYLDVFPVFRRDRLQSTEPLS